jgi:CRP/FNR family transcriptional regulator, cyclic AMP receptor protein
VQKLGKWFEEDTDLVRFAPGQTLFQEGEPGDRMYVIREGDVEISVDSHVVATIGPGSVCGEMALIEDAPRSATARAVGDCAAVAVTQRRFEFLVQEYPWFAIEVMKTMADRLRAMNERV